MKVTTPRLVWFRRTGWSIRSPPIGSNLTCMASLVVSDMCLSSLPRSCQLVALLSEPRLHTSICATSSQPHGSELMYIRSICNSRQGESATCSANSDLAPHARMHDHVSSAAPRRNSHLLSIDDGQYFPVSTC